MREWLKNLRNENRMTQQSVADALGISKQYYQLIETGKRQTDMSSQLVIKLADVFDVSTVSILNMEQEYLTSSIDKGIHI